jgi:hypothetical protein
VLVVIVGIVTALLAYHFTSFVFAVTHTPEEIKVDTFCNDRELVRIVESNNSDAMKHQSLNKCYSKRIEIAHKEIETLTNYEHRN